MTTIDNRLQHALTIFASILIVVAVLLSHHFLPTQVSNLETDTIRSLHGPGFGVVSLLILFIVRRRGAGPASMYFLAAILTMLLACLAEAIQIPTARVAEIRDLLVDALGVFGFLGTVALFDRDIRTLLGKQRVTLLSLFCIPALMAAVWPTLWLCYALTMRIQSLPQLLSFDAAWERAYISGEGIGPETIPAPANWPDGSGNIGLLRSSSRFGLMLHIYPDPDWSEYSAVSFVAATANQETRRIAVGLWGISPGKGAAQGRYYTIIRVGPIPTRYCLAFSALGELPADEKFDLSKVYEMLLGATQAEANVSLLVDDFRLESQPDSCSSQVDE